MLDRSAGHGRLLMDDDGHCGTMLKPVAERHRLTSSHIDFPCDRFSICRYGICLCERIRLENSLLELPTTRKKTSELTITPSMSKANQGARWDHLDRHSFTYTILPSATCSADADTDARSSSSTKLSGFWSSTHQLILPRRSEDGAAVKSRIERASHHDMSPEELCCSDIFFLPAHDWLSTGVY